MWKILPIPKLNNVRHRLFKKNKKDTPFKLQFLLMSAFLKRDILDNDISNSLRIDKIIEKFIRLENLKNEVKKLVLN